MPADEKAALITRHGLAPDRVTPPCNVTLLRDGTNSVLFDLGAGPDFQPTAGKLPETLAAFGLTAEDVTHLLFTHGHPDHLWGLLDDFNEPFFPNAEYMMGQAEFEHWMHPDTVARMAAGREFLAVGAARRLAMIADTLRLLSDGEEPLPDITARLTPGHTPGHMAYEIAGPSPAIVLGDCIANHHVAFERPDWGSNSDHDKDLAASTRVGLLDRLATDGHAVIGYHLPAGGIGRVERAAKGYRLISDI